MLQLFLEPQDEFKAFIEQNSAALDREGIKKDFDFAKEFMGDNFLYTLAPSSRLKYIQEKLRERGVKDFTETTDSHRIATIMQFVYNLEMSAPEPSALESMIAPFMFKQLEQLGIISVDSEGRVDITKQAQDALETLLPKEELDAIKARAVDNMNKACTDPETGAMSEDNFDRNYELENFGLHGMIAVPEQMRSDIEILRQKYAEKFGRPEKQGRYMCPVNEDVVEFCSKLVEKETGKKLPPIEILVDYERNAPYLDKSQIIVPSTALSADFMLAQCITAELPHLIIPHENLAVKDFMKDRLLFFKRSAWSEGAPLRLQEKVLEEIFIQSGKLNNSAYRTIKVIAKQGINISHHMHPVVVELTGLEATVSHAVYEYMSYMYGWHFVRQLDGNAFRKHLNYESPWESKKLGWNNPLNEADSMAVEDLYSMMRNASETKCKGQLEGEAYSIMLKAFDSWKSDFLD